MIFGCGLNKFSDIRLAEYIKLPNRRYITNVLVGNAERRGQNHVVEFSLYGLNLLNKEVAKFVSKSNLVIKLRILHHVLSQAVS